MSTGKRDIRVAISADFLKAFSVIPRQQQGKVREFIDKFRAAPTSAGIHYEKIAGAQDPHLRSVRIDQTYRGIVFQPEAGNVYLLLWVDHHDEAYQWAANKLFRVHPETGALQVIQVEALSESAAAAGPPQKEKPGVFGKFRDRELVKLGIPDALLPAVRALQTEADLDGAAGKMPQEAYESLYMLAAGYSIEEVYREVESRRPPVPVDTGDIAAALDNPDSKRRFYVVEDALELQELLSAPLEQWRVFLHPSQRRIVEMQANGPMRLLGGAGTGKSVVAMHRAKWLAQTVFTNPNDRILFTTFTRNLAMDIRENMRKLCPVELLKRIEILNLDAWVGQFLQQNGYSYRVVFNQDIGPLWQNAMNMAPAELNLDPSFFRDEWENVIQEQGVATCDEYMAASRIGRGVRLNRIARKQVWPVFEEYRAQLNEHRFKELTDAVRDARLILENRGDILPYRAVVLDEAQDMGAEVFRLLRQIIPASRCEHGNDLFIVGDAHQRIYGRKVVLSRCGVEVRGRSRKLLVNYRTTDETRRWAVRLLEGRPIDDLDGGTDDQKGYKSLMHGPGPSVRAFPSFGSEVGFLADHLKRLADENVPQDTICVIARTNDLLAQYQGALAAKGIQLHRITRTASDDRSKPGVRLATMHRVKGLEFDYIIIAGVTEGIVPLRLASSDEGSVLAQEESETRERALLYVAATRARREVLVTCHGKPSEFLKLKPS